MNNIKRNKKYIMIQLMKKMPSLFLGLILYSVGILLTLHCNLGMGPWDVLHVGIVKHSIFTLGQVSQLVGILILAICHFMDVPLGLASIFNMLFIGFFIDIIEKFNMIKTADILPERILMLFSGILIIGWATYFYLKVNLGAGPRDSLMEGLVKKTNKPVWMIRTFIEGSVLIVGYFLGGPVGIGTLIIALTLGLSIQLAFKIGGYSSENVKHVSLMDLYRDFRLQKEYLSEKNSETYLK
ncbi:YitT family protein [Clostridium sp. BJN0013]|uniref:YitT family protein n=1 Tax=Clostridium sp. BJN0013 TaxID=3236840 RepID=UPI0034C632EB